MLTFIYLYFLIIPIIFGSNTVDDPRLAIFHIKFREFHNHAHRRLDGSCCGQVNMHKQTECLSECALEFRICLEPHSLNIVLTDWEPYNGPCLYGQALTGHWGNTDIIYDIKDAPTHTIDIMQPWPNLFTLVLETYDLVNETKKYIIDRAVHRTLLRPTIQSTNRKDAIIEDWHQVTISTQFSGYTFCIRLNCEMNRYNNDCTKLCITNGNRTRYICDPDGNKICQPGWSGIECDKAICNVGCHPVHGSCIRPGECDCATGWQGVHCDECIKYPGCKHGTCDDAPFTCRCAHNWGGPFCDQDLDYCGRHQPCLNNGICKNSNSTIKPFSCSCTQDFSGEYCETKLAPCTVNPCKRGKCLSRDNVTYECVCEPGWRGDHCEENIDYCLTNTCSNGGTCQDLDGYGFKCICPPGFKGSNCQLRSPCSDSQCVHAIDCTQLAQPVDGINYACDCQPGWTGQFCDQNIDDCVDKCQNGGSCHDLLDDFYCTCPIGFSGRHCEINQECLFYKPCQNKGICLEIPGGYRCECPNGFMGKNCEISLNGCNPNPCQNGAYCYTLSNGFYCKCPDQFYGQFCEHPRPYCGQSGCDTMLDPCLNSLTMIMSSNHTTTSVKLSTSSSALTSNNNNGHNNNERNYLYGVCGPHGTCVSQQDTGDYNCVCGTGFKGKYCHEPINYCEVNPCMHGATCVNGLETYECICEEGFTGIQCEYPLDLCQPNPCQNGGYCQRTLHPGDFQCRCAPGWSGRWCELRTENPCSLSKICFNNGKCHMDHLSPGQFRCECDNHWMGTVCQLPRPEYRPCAVQNLCKNGATCVDSGTSLNCICPPGFDGKYCENDINECNSMPCHNNGTCKNMINSFECDCPKGFIGTDCRININECATNPCAYGATCVDRVDNYECICPEQRYGTHCENVLIEVEPKPPACNFYGRIYDHNDNWTYSCQNCHCNAGQIICTDDFCGYWSCLQAVGQSDRFACQENEICHILSSGLDGECFVPPCYLRTICLNASSPIQEQLQNLLPKFQFGPSQPGCRPNALTLTNHCARILFKFFKPRMSYAITVGDICNALKSLPAMRKFSTHMIHKKGIGMSCDIKAGFDEEVNSIIEVTLSSLDDKLKIAPDGKEYSFIHELARNLSKDVAIKTSTNITVTSRKFNKTNRWKMYTFPPINNIDNEVDIPLPPMAMMLGTAELEEYWHRILLGVMEIQVDTMVVKENDFGPPLLVPLACAMILLIALICIILVCCYSQRKRRELLIKYTTNMKPNNEQTNLMQYLTEANNHLICDRDNNCGEIDYNRMNAKLMKSYPNQDVNTNRIARVLPPQYNRCINNEIKPMRVINSKCNIPTSMTIPNENKLTGLNRMGQLKTNRNMSTVVI